MKDGGPAALGPRIREWREGKGLTKVGLARGLHIRNPAGGTLVADWERGMCYPSYWNLIELAKFFHVTLDDLCDFTLGERDDPC